MRVVYLHQYFLTPEMAGSTRSYEMARRLVTMGHEVHMVTSERPRQSRGSGWRESNEAGIHVHWTPVAYDNTMAYRERMAAFIKFAWRAASRARWLGGDVVFATSTPLTIALPAEYAARITQRPMVFEVRDLWPAVPIAIGAIQHPLLKLAARWLERFAYKNAQEIVALAPGMRDAIVATGYPVDRVTVIPNGCDFDLFADATVGRDLRDRFSWLQDRPLLVFTGTFGLVNGMSYLVELAAHLSQLDPEIRVVAVGSGREFEATRAHAQRLQILDRTLRLVGELPKRDAAAWVQAADMTIALFTGPEVVWRDAVQNKFFDSLAAGKPVANNFPGWQAQIAAEAGAGIILSPTDHKAAALELAGRLRDRAWLARASAAAGRLAHECFNRDRLAATLAEVLERAQNSAR